MLADVGVGRSNGFADRVLYDDGGVEADSCECARE